MFKNSLLYTLFLLSSFFGFSQELVPFKLYNQQGQPIEYKTMIQDLAQQDVVLFGEFHNNSIVHWLELQVMKHLAQKKSLTFGLEMFERDQQSVLNEYLSHQIDEKKWDTITRFWNNYPTDYRPMIEYAKTHQIPVIATNVTRKYASQLYKQGEESLFNLPKEELQYIAPLPFPYDPELPSYKKMMEMFGDSDHANPNFPKAQAIKDATMAYSIAQNYKPSTLCYHINGSYHSNDYEGIYWYLKQYAPYLAIKTITVVEADDVQQFDQEQTPKADYIFYIPKDMIKTYE